MMNRKIFVFIYILLIMITSIPLPAQPQTVQVKEELNTLLEELGINKEEPEKVDNPVLDFLSGIIEGIVSFIAFLLEAGSYLAIPIIILLVFLVGYVGLTFFSRFRKERDKAAQSYNTEKRMGEEITEHSYSRYMTDAERHAQHGEFGEALVLLHKASIVFLRLKKILISGEYHTNNEICRDLMKKRTYYEAFRILAQAAERKTFRSEVISQDVYKEIFDVYKKNFV